MIHVRQAKKHGFFWPDCPQSSLAVCSLREKFTRVHSSLVVTLLYWEITKLKEKLRKIDSDVESREDARFVGDEGHE